MTPHTVLKPHGLQSEYSALDLEHPVTIGSYMNEPDLLNNKYLSVCFAYFIKSSFINGLKLIHCVSSCLLKSFKLLINVMNFSFRYIVMIAVNKDKTSGAFTVADAFSFHYMHKNYHAFEQYWIGMLAIPL